MISFGNHSKMYSLLPKNKNDEWVNQRNSMFYFFDFNDKWEFVLYVSKKFDHPEAKAVTSLLQTKGDFVKEATLLAEQGSFSAMIILGYQYNVNEYKRWYWIGKILDLGERGIFLNQVYRNQRYMTNFGLIFIGRYLKNNIDVFGLPLEVLRKLEKAVELYDIQMMKCRKAVDEWTLVGLRFGVVKDIRKLIGMIIWESRNEELYF